MLSTCGLDGDICLVRGSPTNRVCLGIVGADIVTEAKYVK